MTDNNKKRIGSFRKFLPNIFFKSKEKTSAKDVQKDSNEISVRNNQYGNSPFSNGVNKQFGYQDDSSGTIYENLTVLKTNKIENLSNGDSSQNSSSSTLVSECNINKNKNVISQNAIQYHVDADHTSNDYKARPQVPPKPEYEKLHLNSSVIEPGHSTNNAYPDIYYHSVEKLTDKITPIDELEIYKANRAQVNLASVGAEIKKVSTKFLISPKKEAEVRTIKPKRAKSFTLDKKKSHVVNSQEYDPPIHEDVRKPYYYSAPTSPTPANHKIPNMPETVSPYGLVRKSIVQAEEMKNSLGRNSVERRTASPKPSVQSVKMSSPSKLIQDNTQEPIYDNTQKEKTRQKLEAFYWQKLKEQKLQEDEYLLNQSLNSPTSINKQISYRSSLRSTPNPQINEPRSLSLCSSVGFKKHNMNHTGYGQSFYIAEAKSRDEALRNIDPKENDNEYDLEVTYRHPHKLLAANQSVVKEEPKYEGTLRQESTSSLPKRVSFEEQVLKSQYGHNKLNLSKLLDVYKFNSLRNEVLKRPQTPPPSVPVSSDHKDTVVKNERRMFFGGNYPIYSESESGSEAGEIQRIFRNSGQRGGISDGEAGRGPVRGRPSRRDDPRRHTLAGNHLYMHPHHAGQINSHEMEKNSYGPKVPEYATVNKNQNKSSISVDPRFRKPPLPRGYQPSSNALLFDDDPGIMSEVETASTGFRRGGKQRSSLPVVRTPSKTLERPLGLVFLQYRNETKRALLPNEITSIDTVKALFVRSFPKQLTMQYMDSPLVKIYIHDSSKDMFYELEDVRAHLRDIRDRSVLRLFESTDLSDGIFPGAVGVGSLVMPPSVVSGVTAGWEQDQSYFSEPEMDSEYHHQHVHKSKVKAPAYYMNTAPSTLPRGTSMHRTYSPGAPPVPADRIKSIPGGTTGVSKSRSFTAPGFPYSYDPLVSDQLYNVPAHADGYMSSPERARVPYEDPYYTQFMGAAAGRPAIAPVINEEESTTVECRAVIEYTDGMYGVGVPAVPRALHHTRPADDMQRLRVEKMERQLANLTGLVHQALQTPAVVPPVVAPRHDLQPNYQSRTPNNQDGARYASIERPPKLGKDKFQKSVSFEKSVSFCDDPPDMSSPKQHSPQHAADSKPAKPAIKSSTLPRTSSQERDRLKPAPPPKPAGLVGQQPLPPQRPITLNVTTDFVLKMQELLRQARDLRLETNQIRRNVLAQTINMRQMLAGALVKISDLTACYCDDNPDTLLSREEEFYRQDILMLENDLYELESTVERLRGQAANRETRVNMADVERIAMVLSRSSKTVTDWKLKFPVLAETMLLKLNSEKEKVVVRLKNLSEEEPQRLEVAMRRCKKLTGTLVTLKRLACVQEQRLPNEGRDERVSPSSSQSSTFCSTAGPSSEEFSDATSQPVAHSKGPAGGGRGGGRGENALDALLDELQTFARPGGGGGGAGGGEPAPAAGGGGGGLRRLHSYPSGSDTDASPPVRARGHHPPKPPVPERHPELLALATRRAPPPPPPPRTTSRSPLASPTSPPPPPQHPSAAPAEPARQALLEQRHQELLKKQRALQEQYARLQMIQRNGPVLPPCAQPDLKKTGSESNLLSKMSLNLAPVPTGSLTHLAGYPPAGAAAPPPAENGVPHEPTSTTNKVYETDIL